MTLHHFAAGTALSLMLSTAAAAEQHDQGMVDVVVGTVVQVPIDQAAAACGLSVVDIQTTMAAQAGEAAASSEDSGAENGGVGTASSGAAGGVEGGVGGHAITADPTEPGNTGTGTGNMTNPTGTTGMGLAGLNVVCIIDQETATRNNVSVDGQSGQ